MSPDPRDRRKRTRPQPRPPAVRTGPSPDDPHQIVYFKRHRADDPSEPELGREALNSYPAKVRATMRAALIAVASAPPKRFAGGGYWEAMKGEMTEWFELRVDGPRSPPLPVVLPARLRRAGRRRATAGRSRRSG